MSNPPSNFREFVGYIIELLNLLVPLIFGLILVLIIWKIIDAWIIHGGDPTKVAEGKQTVLIGVIVLVILSGVWGILAILQSSLFGVSG